jgi:hypothetical protein
MMFTFLHSMIIKGIFLFQRTGLHKFFEPKIIDVTIKFEFNGAFGLNICLKIYVYIVAQWYGF